MFNSSVMRIDKFLAVPRIDMFQRDSVLVQQILADDEVLAFVGQVVVVVLLGWLERIDRAGLGSLDRKSVV